jgi:leader peptidase (prepilin peptidase) / N-methyltransferase
VRALMLTYVALVGACVGSFLNVCITRWPENLSVVRPRSRCPRCERRIAWYDNIPVASWLALRGKCRGCALPISPLYPIVELLTAAIFVASFAWLDDGFVAFRLAVFATILLGIAVTDLRTYTIPDGFTVTGFAFVLVTAVIALFAGIEGPFAGPWQAVLGACVGAGAIAIVGWLGEVALKKEAMGFGDVTLMAFVGAALGPELALLTVFVGAAIGAVTFLAVVLPIVAIRARRAAAAPAHAPVSLEPASEQGGGTPHVPFGVFLAPAALVTLLYGHEIIGAYLAYVIGA